MNPSETIGVQRQRPKSLLRSFPAASRQSPFDDSRDDDDDDDGDVFFLSDCDSEVAESLLPTDFDVDDEDQISSFLLSLTESREEELLSPSNQNGEFGASPVPATLPFAVAAATGLSRSSRLVSRVRFADNPVSGVKVIPNHRSLTKEQKRSMYRDPRTLQAEAETNYSEREFERSRNCFENALEEECFFRDRRGELIHPAHWTAFVGDIVSSLAVDSSVPPGFSSLDEYVNHLFAYERYFDAAVQSKLFEPSDV